MRRLASRAVTNRSALRSIFSSRARSSAGRRSASVDATRMFRNSSADRFGSKENRNLRRAPPELGTRGQFGSVAMGIPGQRRSCLRMQRSDIDRSRWVTTADSDPWWMLGPSSDVRGVLKTTYPAPIGNTMTEAARSCAVSDNLRLAVFRCAARGCVRSGRNGADGTLRSLGGWECMSALALASVRVLPMVTSTGFEARLLKLCSAQGWRSTRMSPIAWTGVVVSGLQPKSTLATCQEGHQ